MYNNSKTIFLSCVLSFSFLLAPATPANAVNGPGDVVALVTTATIAVSTGLSAYTWYNAGNPDFVLNQLALIQGSESWAAWTLKNSKYLTILGGTISAMMLANFCTHTGIAALDIRLGLPRH